jgi:hypothetical protein
MPWKTAIRSCRNLVSRFDRREMDKFDSATEPANIERYQVWLTRTLVWISVVVVLAALSFLLSVLPAWK